MPEINQFGNPFSGLTGGGGGVGVAVEGPRFGGGGGTNPLALVGDAQQMAQRQQQMAMQQQQFGLQQALGVQELQNRQFQGAQAQMELQITLQKMAAQKRAGALMQRNWNQESGDLDWYSYLGDIAKDPMTTQMFPDIYAAALGGQKVQAETMAKNLESSLQRTNHLGGIAANLYGEYIAKGQHVPPGAFMSGVASAITGGVLTKEQGMGIIAAMPADIRSGEGSATLDGMVQQFMQQAELSDNAMKRAYGEMMVVNAGGRQDIMRTMPGGTPQVVGQSYATPTAEQLNEPKTSMDLVTGQTHTFPAGSPVNPNPVMAPGPSGPEPYVATPAQGTTSAAPAVATPTPAPSSQYSDVTADPRLALRMQQESSNLQQYVKDLNESVRSAQTAYQMIKTQQRALEQFTPGPGGKTFQKLATGAKALGASDAADRLAGGNYAAAQLFDKNSLPLAIMNMRQVTGQQNRDLSTTELKTFWASNADLSTDPVAARNLLSYTEDMAKLKLKEASAFEAWTSPSEKYPQGRPPEEFQNKWLSWIANPEIVKKMGLKYTYSVQSREETLREMGVPNEPEAQ